MTLTIIAAALLQAAAGAPAATGAPNAAPAPAQAPAAETGAVLSTQFPIETLMANPEARAVVLRTFPDLEQNPMYEALKSRSFRQIQPMAQGTITEAQLDEIDAGLRALAQ